MSRFIAVLGAAAVGLTAAGAGEVAAVQERPDFSGSWTIARDDEGGGGGRGRTPGTLGSGWGAEFTVAQTADTLMVEREFFSRGDLQRPLRFRFALDGSETRNAVRMGRGEQESTSTATWEGDRLVITTVHEVSRADGGTLRSEVTRTMWLDPSPATGGPPSLVIETVRGGVLGGAPSTTRTEYRRG